MRGGTVAEATRLVLTLVLVATSAAWAQNGPLPLSLSIEEALRRAEAASEQIVIAKAGVLRAESQKTQARSELLPQVNGSASYDRTLLSEFDFLREAPPIPGAPADGSLFEDLPFGRPNTWRVGATLSQNLWTGGRLTAQRNLAGASFESARVNLEAARASAVLEVAQAYYDAVLTRRLVEIEEASFAQAEKTLEQTRLGHEAGARPEFDVLRARVTLENQRPQVLQQRVQQDLAELRLRQLLELPGDRPLQLTSQLGDDTLRSVATVAREAAELRAEAQDKRGAVLQAGEFVRIREAGVEIAQSQHWPALSLNSSFGIVNYPEALLPRFDEWRPNWTVGVALRVPIFTGLRIQGDVRAAEADLMEARAQYSQLEELARLDTLNAKRQLESAELVWSASAGAVQQAEEAYGIAELRYQEGISTQLELADARLLLEQARAMRAMAARDLQVQRIRVALLPRLPLSGVSANTSSAPPPTSQQSATPTGGAAPAASQAVTPTGSPTGF